MKKTYKIIKLKGKYYILSDEEIGEDDLVIWKGSIFIVNSDRAYSRTKYITKTYCNKYNHVKKIIASTDKSLNLPSIPQYYIDLHIQTNDVKLILYNSICNLTGDVLPHSNIDEIKR